MQQVNAPMCIVRMGLCLQRSICWTLLLTGPAPGARMPAALSKHGPALGAAPQETRVPRRVSTIVAVRSPGK